MTKTFYENKVIHPEKSWLFIEDTKENIMKDLENYTLDPMFEKYGNFVYSPTFKNEEHKRKWVEKFGDGMTCITGNFLKLSHAFRVITNDEELIKEFEIAIRKNQQTEEYKEAKQYA